MKQQYYTSETISKKANEIIQRINKNGKKSYSSFKPRDCALLILDMQNYFLDEQSHAFIPSAPAIRSKINLLATVFKDNSLPVFLTRHLNTHENAKLMKTWWKDMITADSPLSDIIPELQHPEYTVIEKSQYDAFFQTNLGTLLKENDISRIVITGVMTHLCVESTARSAFVRGYTVFLPVDGTATYNESFHYSSFLNLSHGVVIPTVIDDLISMFKG